MAPHDLSSGDWERTARLPSQHGTSKFSLGAWAQAHTCLKMEGLIYEPFHLPKEPSRDLKKLKKLQEEPSRDLKKLAAGVFLKTSAWFISLNGKQVGDED